MPLAARVLSVLVLVYVCRRGLSTFASDLRGHRVVVHSDNTVAEHGMRKGRARSFDHTAVVHSVWCRVIESVAARRPVPDVFCFCRTLALELGIQLYIVRVPTKDNLSDDPSRERYGLLEQLGVRMFARVGGNVLGCMCSVIVFAPG